MGYTKNAQAQNLLARIRQSQQIFWLHIPKCGTSFYNTLYHWMCPIIPTSVKLRQRGNIEDYHRYFPDWAFCGIHSRARSGHLSYDEKRDKGLAVGLFRSPASRIVSGFNANFHHYGMARGTINTFKPAMQTALLKGGPTLALKQYAEWPGIAHCQTKMLVGAACATDKITVTEHVVNTALQNLHQGFIFVG